MKNTTIAHKGRKYRLFLEACLILDRPELEWDQAIAQTSHILVAEKETRRIKRFPLYPTSIEARDSESALASINEELQACFEEAHSASQKREQEAATKSAQAEAGEKIKAWTSHNLIQEMSQPGESPKHSEAPREEKNPSTLRSALESLRLQLAQHACTNMDSDSKLCDIAGIEALTSFLNSMV